jgi:hypothetical protein
MGHAAHILGKKTTHRVLVRIPERKSHLEDTRYRWKNSEMDLKKQDGDSWT